MLAEGLFEDKRTTSLQFVCHLVFSSYKKKKLFQFLKRIPLVYHSRAKKKYEKKIDHTLEFIFRSNQNVLFFLLNILFLFWDREKYQFIKIIIFCQLKIIRRFQ